MMKVKVKYRHRHWVWEWLLDSSSKASKVIIGTWTTQTLLLAGKHSPSSPNPHCAEGMIQQQLTMAPYALTNNDAPQITPSLPEKPYTNTHPSSLSISQLGGAGPSSGIHDSWGNFCIFVIPHMALHLIDLCTYMLIYRKWHESHTYNTCQYTEIDMDYIHSGIRKSIQMSDTSYKCIPGSSVSSCTWLSIQPSIAWIYTNSYYSFCAWKFWFVQTERNGIGHASWGKQIQVNKGRAERCTDTERKTRSTTKRVTSEFEFTERHPNLSSPQLLK